MSKWNETGILRKKQVKDNYDELLVFGYACKIFRDDEKALYIDQGKHLIPWMGDEKLKIDRYDGRGALSDLVSCEASKEDYDTKRWLGLSESERKIEQLCDEERYYSLHTNEEEEAMYKEEESKRQQTNEFQYSYDVPRDPAEENSQDPVPTCEEEVKPYVPPAELDVPVDISIPKTLKENARIEKTALFISKQGPQMEILIKAKQADNPQFNFMNSTDPLYKYYRHVLAAIKSGRYKPVTEPEPKEEEPKDADTSTEEHYLHPSLVQAQAPPSVSAPIRLPPIPYKPTADCAYTQLVTRIQGSSTQADGSTPPPPPPPPQDAPKTAPITPEQQQQYYQYYYSMQYYEYYKQIAQQYAAQAGCDPQAILQNPQLQEQIQAQASHYAQVACNQYIQQQTSSNPYAQIVTNLAPNIKANTLPVETQPPPPPTTATATVAPVEVPKQPEIKPNKPLKSLVYYSSDSEEEEDEDKADTPKTEEVKMTFKVPPDDMAIIIDKMANYVSKNGIDFEKIVRDRKDLRFQFLNEDHEYYKYYKHKLAEYMKDEKVEKKKTTALERNGSISKEKERLKEKKIITPVSFSIKKPKEESPKEIKSALPIEESDEEVEDVTQNNNQQQSAVSPTIESKSAASPPSESLSMPTQRESPEKKEFTSDDTKTSNGTSFLDGDDPILEMIDLTDDLEERRDARRAEDKIKDKLAMVAKEKLSSRSKDRALQMERRKRAAMFLKMKSAGSGGASDSETRTVTKVKKSKHDEDRLSSKKTKDVVLKIDDSESEEGEIRNCKKSSSKKKKSHKRKSSRSRSRHESKSHHRKSKKRRRRSTSRTSSSSES